MKKYLYFSIIGLLLMSCNSEPSIQKYFVENSENKNFISLDVAPSILNLKANTLTSEEQSALKSFEKMNVLAFKVNEKNQSEYETEKSKVTTILKDEKYQQLMKFGSGSQGASVSYVGDEDHINEFIIFANKKQNGFAVVRILGKDMNPTNFMTMMSVLKKSNVDLDQFKQLQDIMK